MDGTLGGGGHATALLAKGAKIIGLDRDGGAIGYCIQHLVVYDGDSVRLVRTNFRGLSRALNHLRINNVDGILLDLGVSSAPTRPCRAGLQLSESGSARYADGSVVRPKPRRASSTALRRRSCNGFFACTGRSLPAGRVAAAIVKKREAAPIEDTLSLARVVESVVPKHGPRHPATRVFQALRMAVNDELGALTDTLAAAADRLNPGGRLAVITFHSLEDRLVKNFVRETSTATIDRPEWPGPRPQSPLRVPRGPTPGHPTGRNRATRKSAFPQREAARAGKNFPCPLRRLAAHRFNHRPPPPNASNSLSV